MLNQNIEVITKENNKLNAESNIELSTQPNAGNKPDLTLNWTLNWMLCWTSNRMLKMIVELDVELNVELKAGLSAELNVESNAESNSEFVEFSHKPTICS